MVSSSASLHIDQRHSRDKDSLSDRWFLRQAAKRVTSSLRDIPGVRVLSCSQMCGMNSNSMNHKTIESVIQQIRLVVLILHTMVKGTRER